MPHLPQPVRSFARAFTPVARRARKIEAAKKAAPRISKRRPSVAVASGEPVDSAPVEMLASETSES